MGRFDIRWSFCGQISNLGAFVTSNLDGHVRPYKVGFRWWHCHLSPIIYAPLLPHIDSMLDALKTKLANLSLDSILSHLISNPDSILDGI